jgi:hypothetical protein
MDFFLFCILPLAAVAVAALLKAFKEYGISKNIFREWLRKIV